MSLSAIDPEFVPFEAQARELNDQMWRLPLSEAREALANAPMPLGEDVPRLSEIRAHKELIPLYDGEEVEMLVYTPKTAAKPLPLLFVTHGGGFVVGSHSIEEALMRLVCVKNNFVVVSVLYRLAPESPFPYAINDSFHVLKWCMETADKLQIDPKIIIVGGSSAGANLAAVLAIKARDEGLHCIVGQILNIPVICHPDLFPKDGYPFKSYQENADAPVIDAHRMRWFWEQYVPQVEKDPHHSPILTPSLKGLPPALIQVAGMDPLRDEGLAYSEALNKAGVNVDLKVYPGLPHGFTMFPQLSSTPRYTKAIVDWVAALISAV